MDKYLLISSSEKINESLIKLLNHSMKCNIDTISNSGQARRYLIEHDYDIVIINTPLKDETGIELSCDIAESYDCGVLLLVKYELADQVQEKVEDSGVFVIAKPINPDVMFGALKFVTASHKRIAAIREREQALSKKIEAIRVVDRAKCCLIQYLNMSEDEAHHHIEKQAMNLRKTKKEIAEDILKTYEA